VGVVKRAASNKHPVGLAKASPSFTLSVDSKRRPTFPVQLLEAAQISLDEPLVAHAEGEGRIVLETRAAVKRRLQQRFQTAARAAGSSDLVTGLLDERAADASLDE
jgi:bifunctional DNA-binding transcriptional regulator/antitoxin component of YhaV-PrlF toxin-antitoxin module